MQKLIYTVFKIHADETAEVTTQFTIEGSEARTFFEHSKKILRSLNYQEHYIEQRTFERSIFVNGDTEVKLVYTNRGNTHYVS